MSLKKIEEMNNPLLNRKRINFELEFSGATPSRKDIMKDISSSIKIKEELIVIRHIYQKYGMNKAKVIAHIYDNIKDLKSIEPKKKKMPEKEAKQEVKKPESKKEEVKEDKPEVKVDKTKEDGKEENKK